MALLVYTNKSTLVYILMITMMRATIKMIIRRRRDTLAKRNMLRKAMAYDTEKIKNEPNGSSTIRKWTPKLPRGDQMDLKMRQETLWSPKMGERNPSKGRECVVSMRPK